MRFLCFSFLSPPATDAESACVGRFLSALVAVGNDVKLISLDHRSAKDHLSDDIANELLDGRISVLRLPLRHVSLAMRIFSKIKHGLFSACTEYIDDAVELVRQDLIAHPGTILITRCAWPASNIVGWKCRRYAKMWVPHFSDPFPSYKKMIWREYWRYPFAYLWLVRILRDSSLVTVTCHNAVRYFDEITSGRYHDKLNVIYHIGAPRLRSSGYILPRHGDEKIIVHVGALLAGRPVGHFAAVASQFTGVRFIQFGKVYDEKLKGLIESYDIESPRMSTDAMANADAILVCDLDSGFGYTPYLPSKFAYALVLGKPLICLTTPDSEMARIAKTVSGIYCLDMLRSDYKEINHLLKQFVSGCLVCPAAAETNKTASFLKIC